MQRDRNLANGFLRGERIGSPQGCCTSTAELLFGKTNIVKTILARYFTVCSVLLNTSIDHE